MSNHSEEKLDKFLDYPFDAFLMVRLEFVLIFQDELEAKILRIIEKYVATERKHLYLETVNTMGTPPAGIVEVTKDVSVAISYKTFMSDLFGTVTSENTVKRAIKSLESKKVIFRTYDQKQRYDAPEYQINQPVLQWLINTLKMPGYQNLIPSKIEALKNLPPQKLTPSGWQILIPSLEELSTNEELRVSKFDTNYKSNTKITNKREKSDASPHSENGNYSHISTASGQLSAKDVNNSPTDQEDAPSEPHQDEPPTVSGPKTPQERVNTPPLPEKPSKSHSSAKSANASQSNQASYSRQNIAIPHEEFVVPESLRARVTQVYEKLNELRREVTNDPAQCFVPDVESDRAICNLFKGKPPTPKLLEKLFKLLWDEPRNTRTGWLTKEHMSVKYICQEYKVREMALLASEQKEAAKGAMRSVGAYTFKPEPDDDEELTYVNLKDLNKGRKRA